MGHIKISPNKQYRPGKISENENKIFEMEFDQLHIYEKPTFMDKDRFKLTPTPLDARLRNLSYEAELHMDVIYTIKQLDEEGNFDILKRERFHKLPIAHIPIMVKSNYCVLH